MSKPSFAPVEGVGLVVVPFEAARIIAQVLETVNAFLVMVVVVVVASAWATVETDIDCDHNVANFDDVDSFVDILAFVVFMVDNAFIINILEVDILVNITATSIIIINFNGP